MPDAISADLPSKPCWARLAQRFDRLKDQSRYRPSSATS
jgi:hypothetical protein